MNGDKSPIARRETDCISRSAREEHAVQIRVSICGHLSAHEFIISTKTQLEILCLKTVPFDSKSLEVCQALEVTCSANLNLRDKTQGDNLCLYDA
jgi:hypothetical protein